MHPPGPLPPAAILTGPTAAGKTGLALHLADQLPVRLISADSVQVYRGLNIGSAKPDAETLSRYPHDGIDLLDPEQRYSAAQFVTDVERAMRAAWQRGQWPLIVGGTPLYLRALLYGLDALPEADPALRQRLQSRAEAEGWASLHAELAAVDPELARRLPVGDRQRILRGLEIVALTAQAPSRLHSQPRLPRFRCLRVVVTPSQRADLHQNIAKRLDAMMNAGFVAEVEALRQRPRLSADHPSMRAVGYRQVWQYLDGVGDLAACRQAMLAATRQLAKRQLTALRQLHGAVWYDAGRGCEQVLTDRVNRFFEPVLGLIEE